ncbi:hypothetical protein ACFQJ5_07790 [Halomicroarcula sp. GCM10025324]|uniref:hypothetical protein n=1 Tax=Haloarcula TaxID=2237 RepID=UPI0023E8C3B8|nr:hypothetical protein [Halomicroarcula sp. ZS-22-S1]
MQRRQVLSTVALSVASLAACSAPSSPGTDDGTTTDTSTRTVTPATESTATPSTDPTQTEAVTPDPDDPIAVDLYNTTEETLTVQVTVTESERVLLDRSLSVAPADEPSLDTGISQTGSYEVTVAIEDGPSVTDPFPVGPYDIRMGSNAVVELSLEQIRIYFEE